MGGAASWYCSTARAAGTARAALHLRSALCLQTALCLRTVLCLLSLACWAGTPAHAIDEIQVYNSEINDVGQWSLQLHNNYALQGRTQRELPDGFAPDRALQGTPELAYGIKDWWELGLYWPYAYTSDGRLLDGGIKLRTLFVAPHAKERRWLLGINFELSNAPAAFAETPWNLEARPIVGWRGGGWEVILNPIVDFALSGSVDHRGDFQPALRVAYTVNAAWQAGVEHYTDLGPTDAWLPGNEQAHTTYAVVDWSGPIDVEAGIGHGWTAASDETIFKTILGFSF